MIETFDEFIDAMEWHFLESEARCLEFCEKGIWVTAEGKELAITDMKTSHIQNCINMINRSDGYDYMRCYIKVFEKELEDKE